MQRVDAARAFQMMHAAAYRRQIPPFAAALETRQHPFPDSMTRVFDDVTVGLQFSGVQTSNTTFCGGFGNASTSFSR